MQYSNGLTEHIAIPKNLFLHFYIVFHFYSDLEKFPCSSLADVKILADKSHSTLPIYCSQLIFQMWSVIPFE